jgi:hypothetical protein
VRSRPARGNQCLNFQGSSSADLVLLQLFVHDDSNDMVKNLSPAYFGMVMATGIVSIAALLLGMPLVAKALFFLNIGMYTALAILTVLRMTRFPGEFFMDLWTTCADRVSLLRSPDHVSSAVSSC